MAGEALAYQIEHDGHGGAGPRRGPQQGGDGAVGGRYHLGAELQYAAFLLVFFDDLHALAGHGKLPVGGVGRGIVLAQGGGAVNDLAWLNDYSLAKLICELPVPVLTGIGHERDSTVLDEVAHTKFDTPSKVIAGIEQVIVRRTHEAADAYDSAMLAAELAVEKAKASVERFDADVGVGVGRRRRSAELFAAVKDVSVATIHHARVLTNDRVAAVRQGSAQTVAEARNESTANADFVLERAQSHTLRVRAAVDVSYALMSQSARRAVQDAKSRSEALMREIAGQGPEKNLERGFAVIRDVGGKPVTRVTQVTPGQVVSVQFSDGAVGAQLDGVRK